MKPINKVIIKNMESRRVINEVVEVFARHAIYSSRDLYSDYDQFQLVEENKNLTTIKISLNLMHMYTLLQCVTNLMVHM